jgi:hypothetical protein
MHAQCAGFAFHRTGDGGFGNKISSLAGVCTAELIVLFVTLRHIEKVILSSVKALLSRKVSHRTHPLVYK